MSIFDLLLGTTKNKADSKPKRKTQQQKDKEQLEKERKLWELAEEYEED